MIISENLTKNKDVFDLIIFDIDGVLIDTDTSYFNAVVDAAHVFLKENMIKCNKEHFKKLLQKIKSIEGFNNDWDCAEALLIFILLEKSGVLVDLNNFLMIFKNNYCRNLKFPEWVRIITKDSMSIKVKNYNTFFVRRIAMEMYAGELSNKLYGIDFLGYRKFGSHMNEKVLADKKLLEALPLSKGIYTGRNYGELKLALEKLSFDKWDRELFYYDSGKNKKYLKPSPLPFVEAYEKSNSNGLIFAGDSPDDLKAFSNFKILRPKIHAEFVFINKTIDLNYFNNGFSQVKDINQLLKFLITGDKNETM